MTEKWMRELEEYLDKVVDACMNCPYLERCLDEYTHR